jgi:carboxypeptidase D
VWHALQVFAADFPEHRRPRDRWRFSVWTESYGGHYGPALARFVAAQNARVAAGDLGPRRAWRALPLDALGVIAGTIDTAVEAEPALRYRFNNTYGLRMVSQAAYSAARAKIPACRAGIARCRQAAARLDPDDRGGNAASNAACVDVFRACSGSGGGEGGRSAYDIASPALGAILHPPFFL